MVKYTGFAIVGGCGLPADVDIEAEGSAGDSSYSYVGFGAGWTGFVAYIGGVWRCVTQIGPFSQWVSSNVPLSWDAASKSFKGTASTNCGPGYGCTLSWSIEFLPRLWAGEQPVRRKLEEKNPDDLTVWQWDEQVEQLPGASRRLVKDGGRLWLAGHARGVVRDWGGWGLPRHSGSYVHWLYD